MAKPKQYVTLILSRFPHDEFIFDTQTGDNLDEVDDLSDADRAALYRTKNRKGREVPLTRVSGLWGSLLMLVGPKVKQVQFNQPIISVLREDERRETETFTGRTLHLIVSGEKVSDRKEYTTVERYRTDTGQLNQWDMGYVRLISLPAPYGLRVETGNSTVAKLHKGKHDGYCIRVLGGKTEQQRGILIHEAPHVGWVVGCIGPRPKDDRRAYDNVAGNPADKAVREIGATISKIGSGKGELFVTKG